MKRVFYIPLLVTLLLMAALRLNAQTGFEFKGVARGCSCSTLPNSEITVEVTLLTAAASLNDLTQVFTEEHHVTTNASGQYTITVGSVETTAFNALSWAMPPAHILRIKTGDNPAAIYLLSIPSPLVIADIDVNNTITCTQPKTGLRRIFNDGQFEQFCDGDKWVNLCCFNDCSFVPCDENPCGTVTSVSHGGETYNTVSVGCQCWLDRNLNIGTKIDCPYQLYEGLEQTNNSIFERYCYLNSQTNCSTYGGLYQWNEMMNYVTTSGSQGICPSGWHIPTQTEWTTLETVLESKAGKKLQKVGNSCTQGDCMLLGYSGFDALLGGSSTFDDINLKGYFWTSDVGSGNNAIRFFVGNDSDDIEQGEILKTRAYSVRCIKNL